MTDVTPEKINQSIEATWLKLEQAVQQELDKVLAGKSELTASTTAAVVKFLETPKDIATDPHFRKPDLSHYAGMLPEFDEEGDLIQKPTPKPIETATKRKKKEQ